MKLEINLLHICFTVVVACDIVWGAKNHSQLCFFNLTLSCIYHNNECNYTLGVLVGRMCCRVAMETDKRLLLVYMLNGNFEPIICEKIIITSFTVYEYVISMCFQFTCGIMGW